MVYCRVAPENGWPVRQESLSSATQAFSGDVAGVKRRGATARPDSGEYGAHKSTESFRSNLEEQRAPQAVVVLVVPQSHRTGRIAATAAAAGCVNDKAGRLDAHRVTL